MKKSVVLVLVLAVASTSWLVAQEADSESAEAQDSAAETGEADVVDDGAGEAEGEAEPEREPPTDRITFSLPLPEDRGGGEVEGEAGSVEFQSEERAVLDGGVELRYQDIVLRANRIEFDLATEDLLAEGNVILDQGPDRMTAGRVEMNLRTKTGTLTDATVNVAEGYYFQGEKVVKESETVYLIEDGIFTSCEAEVPPWSFRVKEARIEEEAYAKLKKTSMRVKQAPVLWAPYLVWPTKTDRASGLLFPNIGTSNDRGFRLGLAYFLTMGRSYDTTFFVDLYTKEYFALGNEFRYRPSERTEGSFEGYTIWDPEVDDWRWKVRLDHETRDLPLGLRAVAHLEEYSDFAFFRDFTRSLNEKAKNGFYSFGFLAGSWGAQSATLLVDSRENFTTSSGRPVVLRQLPELEYHFNSTRVWRTPIYFSFDGFANYFDVDRSETYQGDYGRIDLAPQVKYPISTLSWLSASLTAGYRFTYWGDTIATGESGTAFTGESLSRSVPIGSAEIIGPSLSRVFELGDGGDEVEEGEEGEGDGRSITKLKHIIQPRIDYTYQDRFDDQELVPVFDERDTINARNLTRVSLVNRLLGKASEEAGGGTREMLTFELARSYSFDSQQALERGPDGEESQWGPVQAIIRSYPSDDLGFRIDSAYSVLNSQTTFLRFTGQFGIPRGQISASWAPTWRATDGEKLSDQAQLGLRFQLIPNKLHIRSGVNYDFQNDLLRDQRHFLTWLGSCFTMNFEYHESRTINQNRRDFLFSVDLKNVGTFLDLNGGQSEGF